MTPKQAITFLNKSKRISLGDKTMANERIVGVFECDQGVFSSNGHMLHLWKGEYSGEFNTEGKPGNDKYADATRSMGNQIAVISVTKEHLKRAVKACRAFKPRYIGVHANTKLQLQATGYNGNAQVFLVNNDTCRLGKRRKVSTTLYRHIGQEHSFSIDPKYIYDAVMGMDDVIIIQVMESGLKFHSELAEAWVMYLND